MRAILDVIAPIGMLACLAYIGHAFLGLMHENVALEIENGELNDELESVRMAFDALGIRWIYEDLGDKSSVIIQSNPGVLCQPGDLSPDRSLQEENAR